MTNEFLQWMAIAYIIQMLLNLKKSTGLLISAIDELLKIGRKNAKKS